MKKLMFIAALATAMTGLSDVTSANCVGYQGLVTDSSNHSLIAPTFIKVGADQQFTLRELTVKLTEDYEPYWEDEWCGGCFAPNDFRMDIFANDGSIEKSFYWQCYNEGDEEDYETIQGWFKQVGQDFVPLIDTELDETLDSGVGFWILGNGNSLVPAGEVSKDDVEFETDASNHSVVGNATPCELTLGQLSVKLTEDYEPYWEDEWCGGCFAPNDFRMDVFANDGSIDRSFYWQYYNEGTEDEYETIQGWFKQVGEDFVPLTAKELEDEKVPAGHSYWVFGNGNTLVVPGPEF